MDQKIKPKRISHLNFPYSIDVKTQVLRREKNIKKVDLRYIKADQNKYLFIKLLKHLKSVRSFSVAFDPNLKFNSLLYLLSKKVGVKNIEISNLEPLEKNYLYDKHEGNWYPRNNVSSLPHTNQAIPLVNSFSLPAFPKTVISLNLEFSTISPSMFLCLGPAIKRLRDVERLGFDHQMPFKNIPAVKKGCFESMFKRKTKLKRLNFHGHLAGTSVVNFKKSLRHSPLKHLSFIENFSNRWGYSNLKLQELLQSQSGLERIDLSIVGGDGELGSLVCSGALNIINKYSKITKLTLDIDTKVALKQEDALATKEALKNFKQVKLINLYYNQNYANLSTKEDTNVVIFETSKLQQVEEAAFYVKDTQNLNLNLRIIKTLSNDVYHFSKLQSLDIRTRIEIHETALLYIIWNIRNMPKLHTLKIKTVLNSTEMQPFPDMQKIPQFINPTSLKNVVIEWVTDFEYTDKIFDFIGRQKNLEELHIGLIRTNNPSINDCSKIMKGLFTLNKLKSFHMLSTSPSMFKPGCFDGYSKIIKNCPSLATFGLTFLAPYSPSIPSNDCLSLNSKSIELGPKVFSMLDDLSKMKHLRDIYLNFRLKAEKREELRPLVQLLNTMPKLKVLSIAIDRFFGNNMNESEISNLKGMIDEISDLRCIECFYLAMGSSTVHQNTKDALKKMWSKMSSLKGFDSIHGLPFTITEKATWLNN